MNKKYNTLYTKDSTDKIRIWYMEQSGDKYRTVSGVLNSNNLVTTEWTTAVPKNTGKKNGTTAKEQATSEILNKIKKQLKTGYFESIDEVNTVQYIEPMLAKKYSDYIDKIKFTDNSWILQVKLNGNRCIATKNGLFTRNGETYISVPHIEDSLKQFFKVNPTAVLDGELYNYNLRQELNELSKLVRKTVHLTPGDYARSKELVEYHIYDGYGFSSLDEDTPYYLRKAWIDTNIVNKYNYVKEVKSHKVWDSISLNNLYNSYVEDGQEGAILRDINSPYEHKRSKYLLKIKPEDSDEGVIIDVHQGEGNWSNTGKIISLLWKGKQFNATFKGTMEEGVTFWQEKDRWIGKPITFLYNGLTGLGVPNYARVDINNCISVDK